MRVIWTAPDSDYAVVSIESSEGLVTAVGQLGLVLGEAGQGAFIAVEGVWDTHATHGKQFKAEGFLQALPRTLSGMSRYLSQAGIDGVGPKSAEAIVAHFGIRSLRILSEEPHRLKEVAGIGPARARVIGEQWAKDASGQALMIRLRGLGLSNRIVRRVRDAYGDKAAFVVSRTPYRLCTDITGIGFHTADRLALSQGLDKASPERTGAAVLHALSEGARSGHCFLKLEELARKVVSLEAEPAHLESQVDRFVTEGRIVRDAAQRVWSSGVWNAEVSVASVIRRLVMSAPRAIEERLFSSMMDAAQARHHIELSLGQRDAVKMALSSPISIITGGPGTGKTTLVRLLLDVAQQLGEHWQLAAPTGRAAKRLEEGTGHPATTIHRLLEYRPPPLGFQRNATEPFESDGLVVDEVSMLDLFLMNDLLAAVPDTDPCFRLVLVGDVDQLPSVGAGNVLKDLILTGRVPKVSLDRVYRQGTDSGILSAAADIHKGTIPESGEKMGYKDYFLLYRQSPDAIMRTTLTVVNEKLPALGYDPMKHVQILTPTRKGPLGTHRLNQELQKCLNPNGARILWGTREFRVGDRVICQRNKHDLNVFNGDIGEVLQVSKTHLRIRFMGIVVQWSRDDALDLDLGYAVTIHKSQGSEYPVVVLIIDRSHYVMLHRNLTYTAVTRAKEFLVVVGDEGAVRRSIQRHIQGTRQTGLQERLSKEKDADDFSHQ